MSKRVTSDVQESTRSEEVAKVKKTASKIPKTKAGTEITPEIVDTLAVEAEHGYDLSKAKRRPVGRASPERPPQAS